MFIFLNCGNLSRRGRGEGEERRSLFARSMGLILQNGAFCLPSAPPLTTVCLACPEALERRVCLWNFSKFNCEAVLEVGVGKFFL